MDIRNRFSQALYRAAKRWPLVVSALALGVLADVVADRHLGLLALPPILAALALSTRATVAISGISIACSLSLLVVFLADEKTFHPTRLAPFVTTTAIAIVAGCISKFRDEREQLLVRNREITRIVQEAIVQPPAPVIGRVAFAARYVPASDDSVGGILFEALDTPFGVRFVIGDLGGTGLESVKRSSSLVRAFRSNCQLQPELGSLVRSIDTTMHGLLNASSHPVNAIFGELSSPTSIDLINIGGQAPMLIEGNTARFLHAGHESARLGLEPLARVERFHLNEGDRVLFYTDGVLPDAELDPALLLDAAGEALRRPGLEMAIEEFLSLMIDPTQTRTRNSALLLLEQLPQLRIHADIAQESRRVAS